MVPGTFLGVIVKRIISILKPVWATMFVLAFALISCSSPTGSGGDTEVPETYTVNINVVGKEGNDSVTVNPKTGKHGDNVTIDYTVSKTKNYNRLDFSGIILALAPIEGEGTGKKSYIINEDDAENGVITIIAYFYHTDLTLDPINFTDESGEITIVYDESPYSNPIEPPPAYNGSGMISYSSSNKAVATVDNSGLVTVNKTGYTFISALKAADEEWAEARAGYNLTIVRASPAAPSAPGLGSRTPGSVTLTVPAGADNRFVLEYGYNTINTAPSAAASWQTGLTFSGLDETVDFHYFFARYKADVNKNNVSAASTALQLETQGDGTAAFPFKVKDVATLQLVGKGNGAYESWNLSAHYIQTQDIDMAGEDFTPIGPDSYGLSSYPGFNGSYNGNGKTIFNLNINTPEYEYAGLFGHIDSGGIVKNISLESCNIGGLYITGGVVGISRGTVQDCYVEGSITGGSEVGGVVGHNIDVHGDVGIVQDCHVAGNVNGGDIVGGVVGRNSGIVQDCHSTASVNGLQRIGGVVGENSGTIQRCFATGNVTGVYEGIDGGTTGFGGVAGRNDGGTVQSCYATGNITGLRLYNGWGIGGVVGENLQDVHGKSSLVKNCYYTTGSMSWGHLGVGGVVGENSGSEVQNCYTTTGVVRGGYYVGGVTGTETTGLTSNCVALNISVINVNIWVPHSLGRIAGMDDEVVTNCYARIDMDIRYDVDYPDGTGGTEKILDKGADKADGADVTAVDYNGANSGTWWKDTAGFSEDAWIFEANKLPILKGFPAGIQNPTVE